MWKDNVLLMFKVKNKKNKWIQTRQLKVMHKNEFNIIFKF